MLATLFSENFKVIEIKFYHYSILKILKMMNLVLMINPKKSFKKCFLE
jgi:hypothetical protein